ncbi:amino acid/amide ABC transporter substrate-binding protein (HAAT family) [Roseiarcus fermentans]|uniref:Amino acid/amide ABC transporter substrate-binding protein (HAAT family) n=1 Tax=Roseiarcus fermentans TaxID=1473586 RepID=A0A366FMF3_9HYPH|nr:ABC transporter substrate-binding protein [Roseiarcus fermentans]RBP15883.1 amino acid/amide ABC transporter substrate-binding protein (HAAT family) [Roseiarcus fermentans]
MASLKALSACALLAASICGAVAPGAAFAAGSIKIGVLAPLTGPSASDGQEFVNGVKWAADEANAAGGVAGYTFEVVPADVKDGSAANVTSAVERLAQTSGVEVVLTGYAALSMFEIDLFKEYGLPYLSAGPSPSVEAIIGKAPEDYWCCWSYTADFGGYATDLLPALKAFAAEGKANIADKTIAIVSSDNPYSKTISEGMKKVFGADGWKIVVDEIVPFGEVGDWRAILAKVRSAKPDVIVNADYLPGNSALFLKQFLEQPTNSVVFLQYAPSVPEFIKLTGPQSTGVLYDLIGGVLDSPKWPRGPELLAAYKAKYGVESGAYGVGLYEMANLYFKALQKVGDPKDHKAIGLAIGEQASNSAAGPIKFDPKTHVALAGDDYVPTTFWQIVDSKRVLVAPAKYANGAFQTPPWIK